MIIGICDDLEKERNSLKMVCNELGHTNIVEFSSSDELINSCILQDIGLLFLDIELDGSSMSGIEIKNVLEEKAPHTFIIFCTSHQELMPNAFGRNVISFINKPFNINSIKECIDRISYLSKSFEPIHINEITTVLCSDIIYLNSEHKYTIFYTTNNNSYSSRLPLIEWEKRLSNYNFCQISRSTIINLKHYTGKLEKNGYALLHNGSSLKVSRRYINTLKELTHAYQISLLRNGKMT